MQGLYDTILRRRSARKFTAKISESLKDNLNNFIVNSIDPLFNDIDYKIVIVDSEQVNSSKVQAPEYLLFYSKKSDRAKINAGYILQQLDLYLQAQGAGVCWLGMASPQVNKIGDLDYIIMLAIGITDKPMRESEDQFKRKSHNEIGNIQDTKVLNAVRLAPSAVNMQPWYYEQVDSTINVHLKRGLIMKLVLSSYDMIDLGISLCHCIVALRESNKKYDIIENNKKSIPISVKLI